MYVRRNAQEVTGAPKLEKAELLLVIEGTTGTTGCIPVAVIVPPTSASAPLILKTNVSAESVGSPTTVVTTLALAIGTFESHTACPGSLLTPTFATDSFTLAALSASGT